MNKKKLVIGIVIGLVVIVGGALFKQTSEINALTYPKSNLAQIKDGSYVSGVDTLLIQAEVKVVVVNHRIESIDILKHQNGLGSKAETIIQAMIEANDWDVDTISGATLSSEVLKSAVSQALKEGEQ